jgi:hypothetical protein
MKGLQPMEQIDHPAIMVFSGPVADRSACGQALTAAGFTLLPETVQEKAGSWGLPSYTDPLTAHAAGKPNSGHHINKTHPNQLNHLEHKCDHVGEPYEPDTGIAWQAAWGEDVDKAIEAVRKVGWQLRLHTSKSVEGVDPNGHTFGGKS